MVALAQSQPAQLIGGSFQFDPAAAMDRCRFTIWDRPRPGRTYVVGADFAYGVGRDWDTACVLDKTAEQETGMAIQVAELQGQLGPDQFHGVLYGILRFFNDAFLLGERQVGLPVMRLLWDQYQYRWMYREKPLSKAAAVEPEAPALGWHRQANDVMIQECRRAVRARSVKFRSAMLLDQMGALEWKPRNTVGDEHREDRDMRLRVRTGGSPDLVMAAGYAVYALREVVHYEKPKPLYPEGSYGDIFKIQERMEQAAARHGDAKPATLAGGAAWVRGSR